MRLRTIIFPALIINCLLFISCNSNKHGDTDPSLPQFGIENNIPIPTTQSDSMSTTINKIQKIQNDVALNPPHGELGHDCSIAVGAPLNNSGNQMVSPNMQTTPVSPTARPNPAHGLPGHSCEIPVGQPLP